MLSENEIRALQVLLQRVDIKGSEASIVSQIQSKLVRMIEESKEETKRPSKVIDEDKKV